MYSITTFCMANKGTNYNKVKIMLINLISIRMHYGNWSEIVTITNTLVLNEFNIGFYWNQAQNSNSIE